MSTLIESSVDPNDSDSNFGHGCDSNVDKFEFNSVDPSFNIHWFEFLNSSNLVKKDSHF
jgi:hypothetical protein